MRVTLDISDSEKAAAAAAFVCELIRQGVPFAAQQVDNELQIIFSGGF